VCGCDSRPCSSSTASSYRTSRTETSIAARSTSVFEPTGAPVATYSSTTRTRISSWRGVSMVQGPCHLRSIVVICRDFSEELGRHAPPRKRPRRVRTQPVAPVARPGRRPSSRSSAASRPRLDLGERKRVVQTQPEHEPLLCLRRRAQRLELPWRSLPAGRAPRCSAAAREGSASAGRRRSRQHRSPARGSRAPASRRGCGGRGGRPGRNWRSRTSGSRHRERVDDELEISLHRLRLAAQLLPCACVKRVPGFASSS
jgi:hypothetical protein